MALLCLILSLVPSGDVLYDRVDVIELNHVYDDWGQHQFDQYIFYDWSPEHERFQVVDFRVANGATRHYPLPELTERDYLLVLDRSEGMRVILAAAIRETWTQWDTELREREILPKEMRRGLTCL